MSLTNTSRDRDLKIQQSLWTLLTVGAVCWHQGFQQITRVANGSLQSFYNGSWHCIHVVLAAKRHRLTRNFSIKANGEATARYADRVEEEEDFESILVILIWQQSLLFKMGVTPDCTAFHCRRGGGVTTHCLQLQFHLAYHCCCLGRREKKKSHVEADQRCKIHHCWKEGEITHTCWKKINLAIQR